MDKYIKRNQLYFLSSFSFSFPLLFKYDIYKSQYDKSLHTKRFASISLQICSSIPLLPASSISLFNIDIEELKHNRRAIFRFVPFDFRRCFVQTIDSDDSIGVVAMHTTDVLFQIRFLVCTKTAIWTTLLFVLAAKYFLMFHQMALPLVAFQAFEARVFILLPIFFQTACRVFHAFHLIVFVFASFFHYDAIVCISLDTLVFKINPCSCDVNVGHVE